MKQQKNLTFTPNYPFYGKTPSALLSTPERVSALPEYTGRDVVIAFIDAGFYPHPDLAGRILVHVDASTNHVLEQETIFEGSDFSWHGQMTSVIAAGDGRTSGGKYRGIASGAKLVLVKVSTPKGQVKETDILRGLRWVADTYRRFNVQIVNLSVGGDFVNTNPDHPLHKMVHKLTQAGITVVAAAGNNPRSAIVPPASAADAITVGGVDDHNSSLEALLTPYHHSYGRGSDGAFKPDLLAPAAWVASPILPGSSVAREAQWLAQMLRQPTTRKLHSLIKKGYADLGLTQQQANNPDGHLYTMLQERIHIHKLIDAHHQYVDGTSVAAPIVSSVVAQMLEANPRLTPHQIRAILTITAKRMQGVPADKQGGGVLNAPGAVLAALNFT